MQLHPLDRFSHILIWKKREVLVKVCDYKRSSRRYFVELLSAAVPKTIVLHLSLEVHSLLTPTTQANATATVTATVA